MSAWHGRVHTTLISYHSFLCCDWFTSLYKNLISEKNELFRRYRRTRLPDDLLLYRQARDHAHKIIQSSRLEYYYTRLSNITDPLLLWKELRHLGVVPAKAENSHDFSSEQLNEYFCSISFDPLTPSLEECLTELQSKELSEFFFLKEIETLDVTAAVNHFSTQSRGPDGISQCIISAALLAIAIYLRDLFNSSMKYSIFPSEWKRSLVLALNKVKTPANPSDFRLISRALSPKVAAQCLHCANFVFACRVYRDDS